jgi:pilus assembly protein CpaD
MRTSPSHSVSRRFGLAVALPLLVALSGCGGMPSNRSLESTHQPVVSRTDYTLDVMAGPDGLSPSEARRLAGWFDAMDLRYGDRISIDDPLQGNASRASVEAVASRWGMLVGEDAPITPGALSAGTVRVIVSRSKATVPGCPDWSANSDTNLANGSSSNYGCAVNSNLAAMVADPQHLLKGAETRGSTSVMSSTKAIDSYRTQPPSGEKGLTATSSKGN